MPESIIPFFRLFFKSLCLQCSRFHVIEPIAKRTGILPVLWARRRRTCFLIVNFARLLLTGATDCAIMIWSRGVAQLGSALGSGPRGRRFESCHSDHFGSEKHFSEPFSLPSAPHFLRADDCFPSALLTFMRFLYLPFRLRSPISFQLSSLRVVFRILLSSWRIR